MTTATRPIDLLAGRLQRVKWKHGGKGLTARCPAHDDATPSLDVSEGPDQRALLICRSRRCTAEAITAAVGLTLADLFVPGTAPQADTVEHHHQREVRREWRVGDAVHVRLDFPDCRLRHGKACRKVWWERGGQPGLNGLGTADLPLYAADRLDDLPDGTVVPVVEGEPATDVLRSIGIPAVGTVTGAEGTPGPAALSVLSRFSVVLWPDADETGKQHMARIAEQIRGKAKSVRRFHWEAAPDGGDAVEYLKLYPDADALRLALEAAPLWDAPETPAHERISSIGLISSLEGFSAIPSVPPFPVHVLPGAARALVEEGAAALGAPADLIAVPLLANAGAAIGNTQCVQLKQGFVQYATLYAATVAPPGSVKTPAHDLARYPLDVMQREAWERFQGELELYNRAMTDRHAAKKSERGPEPDRPIMQHFYSTDATTEAANVMLLHSAGYALFRDELTGWVLSFDQYRGGKGADRQNSLSMWSGSPLKVDRKSGDPIFIQHPVIAVVGGVQPDMLTSLTPEANRRDGFIERILWAYPDVQPAQWTDATVEYSTKQAVVSIFRKLRAVAPAERPVTLDAEARQLWATWFNENQRLTVAASGLIQGVASKLPNQVARLALILHCLHHPNDPTGRPVSAEVMGDAIELGEYFWAHGARVMTHFGVTAVAKSGDIAVRALRVLNDAGGAWVNKRRLFAGVGGVSASDLNTALDELVALGKAEHRTVRDGPGRPAEEWREKNHSKELIKSIQQTPAEECDEGEV